MSDNLTGYIAQTGSAIQLLIDHQYTASAITLLYAWVDQLAWLSVPGDVSKNDFKIWLTEFLPQDANIGCNVDDLWGARCALLHTASSESRDTVAGAARRVHYFGSDAHVPTALPDEVYIHVGTLHLAVVNAVIAFAAKVKSDAALQKNVDQKMQKILVRTSH